MGQGDISAHGFDIDMDFVQVYGFEEAMKQNLQLLSGGGHKF